MSNEPCSENVGTVDLDEWHDLLVATMRPQLETDGFGNIVGIGRAADAVLLMPLDGRTLAEVLYLGRQTAAAFDRMKAAGAFDAEAEDACTNGESS